MNVFGDIDEKMRIRLLEEEFKLRKKQPTAWTKTKYRPYANFRTKRLEKKAEKEALKAAEGNGNLTKAKVKTVKVKKKIVKKK